MAATACYGKAGSSKLFDMVNDILKMPGSRMASRFEDLVLYYQQVQSELGVDVEGLAQCRLLGRCDFQQRGDPGIEGAYGFEVFIKVFSANSGNYGVHKIVSALRSIFGRSVRQPAADTARGTPALRGRYVNAVEALATRVPGMRQAGMSSEQIARVLHAERRALGAQFKGLTPADKLAEITQRNVQLYGDPLGPPIDWLRAQGKSWEQIIESASRAGGRDLGF